jgi:L-iditol 2-dehydrogenase
LQEEEMKTEAIWYLGESKIELRDLEIPEPGPDEVIVAMETCGICAWDVLAFNGRFGKYHPYPFCAGHEGVGRVIEAGPKVRAVKVGQRVALYELPIGTPGGALLARHALRSEREVAVIPEGPLPVHLWIVEPVACVVNGLLYAGIQPGDRVAVVGAGYMGLLFVQGLRRSLTGFITAFDVDSRRLELAQQLGADETVLLKAAGAPERTRGFFDIAIDLAGTPESMRTVMEIVRPGGIIENFAWHHHTQTFDLDDWTVKGWRILNIQPQMNPHFGDLFPRSISLMANGTLSNDKLVTHVEKIEKASRIFAAAAEKTGGYMKGAITF